MFSWIQDIIAWFCELFNPITKLSRFETDPSQVCGYGFVNDWVNLSVAETAKQAEAMAVAGINTTHLEVHSCSEWGGYDKSGEMLKKLYPHAKEFLKRNIVVELNVVNGNHPGLCEYSDKWFQYACIEIKKNLGTTGIRIQGVSEWGPRERNKKCWRKFERWCYWLAAHWPGMISWNKDSRPRSSPGRHVIHYHSASTKDTGPPHSIVVTDHTTTLKQLGAWHHNFDIGKTIAFIHAVRAAGNGIVLYHFRNAEVDYGIIKAIGQMLKEK